MLTRLGCEIIDMGVVPDVPDELSRRLATAAANADVVITSGGVSVGEADYVKQLLDKLGEVLFWKIAMKPGPACWPMGASGRPFLRPAGQSGLGDGEALPRTVRDALLILQGQRDVTPVPMFKATLAAPIRKAPGRTEFQRGILAPGSDGGWTVRTTGVRASASCRRCRRRTAAVVLEHRLQPAMSRPARPSMCNCSKACSDRSARLLRNT